MLVEGRQAYRRVQGFVFVAGVALAAVLAVLALSPAGFWVIEGLHGVEPALGPVIRQALFWLIPIPVLRGLIRFHSGLLIRERQTPVVSYAILVSIALSILTVLSALSFGLFRKQPIGLPILVTYIGTISELAIILWGTRGFRHRLTNDRRKHLSYSEIVQFFWPLAVIMAVQGLSRPLINLFVSRGPDGTQAIAVLTIVYALGHLPYAWLNELRNVPTAFRDETNSLRYTRRFVFACGSVSFASMILLFWTPLYGFILGSLIGIDTELVARSRAPLVLFSFFPVVVSFRAYFHGLGLLQRRTRSMAPSAPSRIGAILLALAVLPVFGVHGAARGVAALLSGFVFETLVVWWGLRVRYAAPFKRYPAEKVA